MERELLVETEEIVIESQGSFQSPSTDMFLEITCPYEYHITWGIYMWKLKHHFCYHAHLNKLEN